ncbi:PucR family transcriptional regulator [Streptomyces hokutonensis]|uniref:PucR family transcriptional regulator n=1 Tax=Streptomyces hokutonensis TaxID=1306990 RepID=UPI0036D0E5AD
MAAQGAGPEAIVATAFAHLERAVAYVLTPSGRTVAATPGAVAISAREATGLLAEALPVDADGVSPYERWHLCLPDPDDAPPRMLHELASVRGRCQEARVRSRAEERQTADELGALLAVPGADPSAVATALRSCGLPEEGPYRVLVAETGAERAGLAEGALAEVVAHAGAGDAAVGRLPDGTAFAVVTQGEAEAKDLNGALAQARYALTSARGIAHGGSVVTDASALIGLDALLTGVPTEVRTAFSRTVLGELRGNAVLLETLETFLACDGSWARTAEALHLHVNSVHYRIGRIEHFTGRDLSRLYDRLALWAALLRRTDSA